MSKSDTSKQVLSLLQKENRPFSLSDVVARCDKELGKSMIQKSLDSLVGHHKVIEKVSGKHKIYFAKQETNLPELKKDLQMYKQKLTQAQIQLKSKQIQVREYELKLKHMSQKRSLGSLEEERDKLLDDIRNLNEKLRRSEAIAQETKLTAADVKKIQKNYERVVTAYRKRKRICNEMLDAILEGYPKSKKSLMEDIGLETDEEAGFQLALK